MTIGEQLLCILFARSVSHLGEFFYFLGACRHRGRGYHKVVMHSLLTIVGSIVIIIITL